MQINPRIADELERLATDIRIDRCGDPHIAFVVLLHPDRTGVTYAVGFEDHSPIDMTQLVYPDETDEKRRTERQKSNMKTLLAELDHAKEAVDDLTMALHVASPTRGPLPDQVAEWMNGARDRRLTYRIEQDMTRADYERKNPAQCEFCSHRFTERGLKRHQRSCYRNPNADQYGPGGEMEPILKDGKVVGSQQRQGTDRSQCGRCPEPRYRHPDDGPCINSACNCQGFVPCATDIERKGTAA